MKVLLSAYASAPHKGSDPGIGWNIGQALSRFHNVWVITREENRRDIEAEVAAVPNPNLHFVFYDLPLWMRWWKKGARGVQLHYYLWQIGILAVARKLHREIGFDVVQHVTYVKHWAPSFVALLPVPFIWGPVGGAESAPKSFRGDLHLRGRCYESIRAIVRWLGEKDPFVKMTARRSAVALAATEETRARLAALGCRRVELCGVAALPSSDIERLASLGPADSSACRLVSIGRLLQWKGFHLGLRAFAHANIPGAEYWIIGDGPERGFLERLARDLEIADRVRFWGSLPRAETLRKLESCHALVHPSLHDSGGWACLEAMAAARPVVCLDLGGPATQVTEETGFKVAAEQPRQAVHDLAAVMVRLAENPDLAVRVGKAAQQRVKEAFGWDAKAQFFTELYEALLWSGASSDGDAGTSPSRCDPS